MPSPIIMPNADNTLDFIAALSPFLMALVAIWVTLRKTTPEVTKTKAEAKKTDAETESIHAQIADRWAEHVKELQNEVHGLRLDINQVRRENEMYRMELSERDEIIADLKDWAERLVRQLETHVPNLKPEQFRKRTQKPKA